MEQYLVMDVGGSHIKYALMTENEIVEKGEVVTPMEGSEAFVAELVRLYRKYEKHVKGIALSLPGRIDDGRGIMHSGGYLDYIHDYPLKAELAKSIPVKISMENDGKSAALAELWKGSLKGVEQGLVIVLGSGIGGGVIVNGKLLRGHRFAAGELSWLPLNLQELGTEEPFMWAHLCGTMGLTDVYERENGLPYHSLSGRQFFDLVNAGNPSAKKILDKFAQSFAIGVLAIQAVLDAQTIAVGGGISAQPILIESLQKAVHDLFTERKVMPIAEPKIVRCAFANDSNLYGALYHHLYE